MNETIGIIGGNGSMGAFMKTVFSKNDYTVLVNDLSSPSVPLDELLQNSSIVMVSVPMSLASELIERVTSKLSKNQLICDTTSIKSEPCKAMEKAKGGALGLHPMFSPKLNTMEKQTIVSSIVKEHPSIQKVLSVFKKEGAEVVSMTPEEHDKSMAFVQALTHFMAFSYVDTMNSKNISATQLMEVSSPIYLMQLLIAGRILSQSSELYADIQLKNPFVIEVLDKFISHATELKEMIVEGRRDDFLARFTKLSDSIDPKLQRTCFDISSELSRSIYKDKFKC